MKSIRSQSVSIFAVFLTTVFLISLGLTSVIAQADVYPSRVIFKRIIFGYWSGTSVLEALVEKNGDFSIEYSVDEDRSSFYQSPYDKSFSFTVKNAPPDWNRFVEEANLLEAKLWISIESFAEYGACDGGGVETSLQVEFSDGSSGSALQRSDMGTCDSPGRIVTTNASALASQHYLFDFVNKSVYKHFYESTGFFDIETSDLVPLMATGLVSAAVGVLLAYVVKRKGTD